MHTPAKFKGRAQQLYVPPRYSAFVQPMPLSLGLSNFLKPSIKRQKSVGVALCMAAHLPTYGLDSGRVLNGVSTTHSGNLCRQ